MFNSIIYYFLEYEKDNLQNCSLTQNFVNLILTAAAKYSFLLQCIGHGIDKTVNILIFYV